MVGLYVFSLEQKTNTHRLSDTLITKKASIYLTSFNIIFIVTWSAVLF